MNNSLRWFVLIACCSLATVVNGGDWLQFGGPTHDFRIADESLSDGAAFTRPPTKRWQRTLGRGMAGVVVDRDLVITSYLKPFAPDEADAPESERPHREVVVALDRDNGEPRWRFEYDAGWLEKQQAFGGRVRAPQSTPAVHGDGVFVIGFTGLMHCLDRATGALIWKKNLVEEFKATPVQFGFSSSPLPLGDQLVVLAGGEDGGLVCFDSETGNLLWNRPCQEASYATPLTWDRPEGTQVVFVTRNRVVGVGCTDGRQLWEHELVGAGLTNVPTPLRIDDEDLLISGQGVKGTRRLRISSKDGVYSVDEVWESSDQFFYCNWVRQNDRLFSCDGSLLKVLDLASGKTIGRFRGYDDSNLLLATDRLVVFHGDGQLSVLEIKQDKLNVLAKYSVMEARCWTPPTLVDGKLYCRGDDQILCVDLIGGDPRAAVVSTKIRKRVLAMGGDVAADAPGALAAIVAAFERDGQKAAWDAYNSVRKQDPDSLTFEERATLASLAREQGLAKFADKILEHRAEDFPTETKRLAKAQSPSKETSIGDNGLVYLEFSIKNITGKTIQAVVQGPSGHPFSYGLPLPAGKPRLENWPVGTKLYRTVSGARTELLLTVQESMAGRIVELPIPKVESK